MTLGVDIKKWDAKDVGVIQSIYDKYYDVDENFTESLIVFLSDTSLQRGASWLLKKHLESGAEISVELVNSLFNKIELLEHWETKLHFLQCLPMIDIPDKNAAELYLFLQSGVKSEIKFVKAWSLGGLIELSEQFHEYRIKSEKYIENALNIESAAIKARIRQASKAHSFWRDIVSGNT